MTKNQRKELQAYHDQLVSRVPALSDWRDVEIEGHVRLWDKTKIKHFLEYARATLQAPDVSFPEMNEKLQEIENAIPAMEKVSLGEGKGEK